MSDLLARLVGAADKRAGGLGQICEELVAGFTDHFLHEGERAVDIGANYAQHTARMADIVGPKGQIDAFEPIPVIFNWLETHLKEKPQVKLHQLALADKAGEAQFCFFKKHTGYSGLKRRGGTPFTDQEGEREDITVQVRRLDDLIADGQRVAMMKLDIEGGEYHAFKGSIALLERDRPMLTFENALGGSVWDYGYSCDDFFGLFEGVGYHIYRPDGKLLTRKDWMNAGPLWEVFGVPIEYEQAAFAFETICKRVIAGQVNYQYKKGKRGFDLFLAILKSRL